MAPDKGKAICQKIVTFGRSDGFFFKCYWASDILCVRYISLRHKICHLVLAWLIDRARTQIFAVLLFPHIA